MFNRMEMENILLVSKNTQFPRAIKRIEYENASLDSKISFVVKINLPYFSTGMLQHENILQKNHLLFLEVNTTLVI